MIRAAWPRFVLGGLFLLCACPIQAVDQVIFKDGFTIVGKRFREQDAIVDRNNGTNVVLPRARGFDIIETGPRWIIYSNRTQQVAKVLEDVPGVDDFREFKREFLVKGRGPLPYARVGRLPEFNEKWVRTIRVDLIHTRGFAEIEQRIFSISPTRVVMPSANYLWYPFFDPREFDPQQIRAYLTNHPDLQEQPGKPEVGKRLDLAEFFMQAGWLDESLAEIAGARSAVPEMWPAELLERVEQLEAGIRKQKTARQIRELEHAMRAGRYQAAAQLARTIDDKLADPERFKSLALAKARLDTIVPRFEKAARLLTSTLNRLELSRTPLGQGALGGGLAVGGLAVTGNSSGLTASQTMLLEAGHQVLLELHPDTAERIDFFISLADQAERRLAAGEPPGATPEQLLALAITGWLKGKNGAEQNVDTALRYWSWRDMLMAYQSEPVLNRRRQLYLDCVATRGSLPPDEIAQIINYLPPAQPENLQNRSGVLVRQDVQPVCSVYRLNTGPLPETANGIDYLVRLPSEYHHGRPSRLLVALNTHVMSAEEIISLLAVEADRHGYIVIAPEWVRPSDEAYDFSGKAHFKARAAIRDALKRFRIDNDRIFLFGFLEGANYALDLGVSHPDLFAGVVAMGANATLPGRAPPLNSTLFTNIVTRHPGTPKSDLPLVNSFLQYANNAQKLPIYITIGAIGGESFTHLRQLFETWMPKGYPALGVVYRGRGFEWFPTEVPIIFDWMEPKKRLVGTATLRVKGPVDPWISMRDSDDRFYWVGSTKLHRENKLETWPNKSFYAAEITADIREGNQIFVRTRGTENVVIWLDRNMINWQQPVSVILNGSPPPGYKPKVLQPDVELMLEQLYQHGDRSLLFLNRLEFPTTR